MEILAHKNSLGTPIYKDFNENCEYCYPSDEKDGFFICRSPMCNHQFKPKGSMVINCPEGHCSFTDDMDDDFAIVDIFLESFDDGSGWIVVDRDQMIDLVEEFSIKEVEYMTWMMRLFGYQEYKDKENYMDIPKGGLILTREIIE